VKEHDFSSTEETEIITPMGLAMVVSEVSCASEARFSFHMVETKAQVRVRTDVSQVTPPMSQGEERAWTSSMFYNTTQNPRPALFFSLLLSNTPFPVILSPMDQQILNQLRDRMLKALHVLQEDLATIRTGRATPALVENVLVTAYEGTAHLKVKEMATISTDGPRTIVIAPFDPSVVRDLERGINAANLGFNASVDGQIIRINIPPLTAERRDEYIKLAHGKVEGGRIMVRQVRHDVMSDLKRKFEAKEISEDDKKRLEKEIQTITDEMMAEIEVLKEKKEEELNTI
jgi:ribosome recycling factor